MNREARLVHETLETAARAAWEAVAEADVIRTDPALWHRASEQLLEAAR